MPFVVDNSVVVAWFFSNQATAYSDAMLGRLVEDSAHVPGIWVLEFSNVLRKAMMAGKVTEVRAREIVGQLAELPIRIDTTPVAVLDNLNLALRYGLSSYDAAYLELALRLQLPIATRDEALAAAARTAGVSLAFAH